MAKAKANKKGGKARVTKPRYVYVIVDSDDRCLASELETVYETADLAFDNLNDEGHSVRRVEINKKKR